MHSMRAQALECVLPQAAGWEFIFTFILVSTVYAVAIGKPNFGNVGPLIIGLSLYACASVGAPAIRPSAQQIPSACCVMCRVS